MGWGGIDTAVDPSAPMALSLGLVNATVINMGHAGCPIVISDVGSVTGSGGAETLNAQLGLVTTESVSLTAATINAASTRTLTNSRITATSKVFVALVGGTYLSGAAGQGAAVAGVQVGAGSATIKFYPSATAAGTLVYAFLVL